MREEQQTFHYEKGHWLLCDRCEKPMPPEFWNRTREKHDFVYEDEVESPFPISFTQTNNGMTLIFEGGYGMFIDPMTEERAKQYSLNICHDCTVAVLDLFPSAIRDRFRGGHPAHNDNTPIEQRCCEYSWCFSDERESVTGVLTGE